MGLGSRGIIRLSWYSIGHPISLIWVCYALTTRQPTHAQQPVIAKGNKITCDGDIPREYHCLRKANSISSPLLRISCRSATKKPAFLGRKETRQRNLARAMDASLKGEFNVIKFCSAPSCHSY